MSITELAPFAVLAAFALTACPAEDDGEDTTNASLTTTIGNTGNPSGMGDESSGADGSGTTPMTTAPTETSASGDSGSGSGSGSGSDDETSAESTSGGDDCFGEAECQDDPDCPGGGSCVSCICIGGSADPDPNWPPSERGCPPGYFEGGSLFGNICFPECMNGADPVSMCPQPETGTAIGACFLISPGSSFDSCETVGDACPNGEVCQMLVGMEAPACARVPDVCVLICNYDGESLTCPDGMLCRPDTLTCEYG